MKHFGDITKINGSEVPIVDIITGGSPCQDLSIAGKREGLDGERSGLFMEQIRIIKEMRDESRRRLSISGTDVDVRDVRPRFMVWENVQGAFSSNGGEDFRVVLEETARVADPDTDVPRLAEGQSWSNAGCILGDGWSIAWRVHDAQFWGVPQRRKRISLVADFGGQSAIEILFERKGMSGDNQQSRAERQDSSLAVEASIGESDFKEEKIAYRKKAHPVNETLPQLWEEAKISDTLNVFDNSEMRTPTIICQTKHHIYDGNRRHDYKPFGDVSETVQAHYGTGGGNCPIVLSFQERAGKEGGGKGILIQKDKIGTLSTLNNQSVVYDSIARRLTPLECERLQGYPDGWTDIGDWTDSKGKIHKGAADSPRYKALGNSIALPFWQWMAERMCNQYDRQVTMASLFDGIGGFPLVFSRCGAIPVWASEIEEFPIAVTKKRFPEENL